MRVRAGGYLIVDDELANADAPADAPDASTAADAPKEAPKVRGTVAHFLYDAQIKHLQARGLWPAAFPQGGSGGGSGSGGGCSGGGRGRGPPGEDFDDLLVANPNHRGVPEDSGEESEEESDDEDDDEEKESEGEEGEGGEGGGGGAGDAAARDSCGRRPL